MSEKRAKHLTLTDLFDNFDQVGVTILEPIFEEVNEVLSKRKRVKRRKKVKTPPAIEKLDALLRVSPLSEYFNFGTKSILLSDTQLGSAENAQHFKTNDLDANSKSIVAPDDNQSASKISETNIREPNEPLFKQPAEKCLKQSTNSRCVVDSCSKQQLLDEIDIFHSPCNAEKASSEPKIKRTRNKENPITDDLQQKSDKNSAKRSKISPSNELIVIPGTPIGQQVHPEKSKSIQLTGTTPVHSNDENSEQVPISERRNDVSTTKTYHCNSSSEIVDRNNSNTQTVIDKIDVDRTLEPLDVPKNHRSRTKTVLNPIIKEGVVIINECENTNLTAVCEIDCGQNTEVRVTRTRTKQIEQAKKDNEVAKLLSEKNKNICVVSTSVSTTKKNNLKLDEKRLEFLNHINPIFATASKIGNKPLSTPFKFDKGKIQKEYTAYLKKEEIKKLTSQQVRSKREDKMQKVQEKKLAAERKRAEIMRKLQKVKEQNEKILNEQRSKMKEEMALKKKQMTEMKLKDAEERRQKDEAARLTKLKQQEAEQKRLAALRLKQEKEAAQLLLKQQSEEIKRKAVEATFTKQMSTQAVVSSKNAGTEQLSGIPVQITTLNISDIEDNDDDDDDDDGLCMKKKKNYTVPSWAKNLDKIELEDQFFLFYNVQKFTSINRNPTSRELLDESVVYPNHKQRTSSFYWSSPETK